MMDLMCVDINTLRLFYIIINIYKDERSVWRVLFYAVAASIVGSDTFFSYYHKLICLKIASL